MGLQLYDGQKQAIEKLGNGKILNGDVGSGKSRTSLAYFYKKECKGKLPTGDGGSFGPMRDPKDLYIITAAVKRDNGEWDSELALFSLSTEEGVGPIDVHVDSWNNVEKYVGVKGAFFIFDEQHLVGTGAWVKAFYKIAKANRWIVLTATPGDQWKDYAAIFIANGFIKNITAFRRRYCVFSPYTDYPKIERYVNTSELEKMRNQVLVKMPDVKRATKHFSVIKVGYDKELYDIVDKNVWDIWHGEPAQNASALCYALRRIVNRDHRRLVAVHDILKNHHKLIVFYNFDFELNGLVKFAEDIGVPYAQYNGHLHQPLPEGERWLYFVNYGSGQEAWNCTETDTIVFYSNNYSWRTMHQAAGRIDRMDTPFSDLYYYQLESDSDLDKAISASIKKKKQFNEKTWVKNR